MGDFFANGFELCCLDDIEEYLAELVTKSMDLERGEGGKGEGRWCEVGERDKKKGRERNPFCGLSPLFKEMKGDNPFFKTFGCFICSHHSLWK